jgi:ATP synthase subunit 6
MILAKLLTFYQNHQTLANAPKTFPTTLPAQTCRVAAEEGLTQEFGANATSFSAAAELAATTQPVNAATPLEQFELLRGTLTGGEALLPSQGYALLPLLFTLLLGGALVFSTPRLLGGSPHQLGAELLVRSLGSFLEANTTRAQLPHLPLFLLLVLSLGLYNLSGLLPYGFTFSAHLVVTLFYSVTLFFGLNYVALQRHRLAYFNLFLPSGTPLGLQPLMVLLELVSYLSRPLSLAIRLFANMMAGHALLKILLSFAQKGLEGPALAKLLSLLALVAIGAILGLELMVALLQVFVFATLCSLYLVDAHNPNH